MNNLINSISKMFSFISAIIGIAIYLDLITVEHKKIIFIIIITIIILRIIIYLITSFFSKKHKDQIKNILSFPPFLDGYTESAFSEHMDRYTKPTFTKVRFDYKDNRFFKRLAKYIKQKLRINSKSDQFLITFDNLLTYVKDKSHGQSVLMVYAEAGMGKTRFMCNLAYNLLLHSSKSKDNKNMKDIKNSLPLIAYGIYYTAFNRKSSIKKIIKEINETKEKIDYILLDGFDECQEYFNNESDKKPLENLISELNKIIDTIGFSKIIISSRVDMLERGGSALLNLKTETKIMETIKDKPINIIKMNRFNDDQIISRCEDIKKIDKSEMPKEVIKKIKKHLSKTRKSKKESILQIPFFISFAKDIFNNIDEETLIDLHQEEALSKIIKACIRKEFNKTLKKMAVDSKLEVYASEMMSFLCKVACKMYKNESLFLTNDEYVLIPCNYPKERLLMIREEKQSEDIFYFQHKLFFEYFLVYHFVHSIADDAVFNSLKEQIDSAITMSLRERRKLLGFYPDTENQHIYINPDFAKRLYAHFLNEFFLDKENKNETIENNVKTFSIKGGHCTVTQSSIRELPKAENVTIVDSPIWNIDRIILLLPLIKSLNYRKFKINEEDNDLLDYVDDRFLTVNKEALLDCNGAYKFGKLAILDATQVKINLSELECFEEVSKEIHIVINNPDELNDLQKIKTEKIKLLVQTEAELLPKLVQMIIDANLKQERFSFYNSIKADFIDKVIKIIQTEKIDTSFKDLLFLEGLHFIELHYSGFMNNYTSHIWYIINAIYERNPKEFYKFTNNSYRKRSKNYGTNHPYTISVLVWYAHNANNKNVNDVYNAILNTDFKYVHIYLHQFALIMSARCQWFLGKYNEALETFDAVYKQLSESISSRNYLFYIRNEIIHGLICQEKYNETLIDLCESTLRLFSDIRGYRLYEQALLNTGLAYSGMKELYNNLEIAIKYYKEAADMGYDEAQNYLGDCYYNGTGVEQSYEKAVEWYKKAAEQGYAQAQNMLGFCYYNGNGVEQSYEKAVEWYLKAAEQGFFIAQYNLGVFYYNGNGVEQSYEKAVEWYQKAAEQGNAEAQSMLGLCYYNGNGVEQSYEKAVEWYLKAAEQGNAQAQNNLGYSYQNGDGVEQSYEKAVEWYRKAAEQGTSRSQYHLGECYQKGLGVNMDIEQAKIWYKKAAEQGDKDAINALDSLEKI